MNSSFSGNEAISFRCTFVKVSFYRDRQELMLNIATCALNVLFAMSSTLLNSVVLLAIWKTRALHTPSNTLLSGLAASDLAVGCIAGDSTTPRTLLPSQNSFGNPHFGGLWDFFSHVNIHRC